MGLQKTHDIKKGQNFWNNLLIFPLTCREILSGDANEYILQVCIHYKYAWKCKHVFKFMRMFF